MSNPFSSKICHVADKKQNRYRYTKRGRGSKNKRLFLTKQMRERKEGTSGAAEMATSKNNGDGDVNEQWRSRRVDLDLATGEFFFPFFLLVSSRIERINIVKILNRVNHRVVDWIAQFARFEILTHLTHSLLKELRLTHLEAHCARLWATCASNISNWDIIFVYNRSLYIGIEKTWIQVKSWSLIYVLNCAIIYSLTS